ncbi:MAG: VWA domain-containing protein [Gammaproteobacteria bacterium]|nr:VWA domain-containing protein [Gammaproteobacteria bacterium]
MIEPGESGEARPSGRLLENIVHFARALRAAGLPIGPGRVKDAVRAVCTVGVTDRDDFYWTLHAVFVNRADQRDIFDQAFHVYWRNPKLLERMLSLVLPGTPVPDPAEAPSLNRRLSDALFPRGASGQEGDKSPPPELELDASLTWSNRELLKHKDFEQMSAAEIAAAKAAIEQLVLPVMSVPTRRYETFPQGRGIDMRASLRAALRTGTGAMPLLRRRHRRRLPPLVILCDISGSMSRYSRMLLHFAHAMTRYRERVSSFVFATRLSNITRALRARDVDEALETVSDTVDDWSGGTRIGACLEQFNRTWSRRVLAQGAVVLLITDGLDREGGDDVSRQAERLTKSCRRLIWLNPLLRFEDFEPRALGMRALMPHVDDFRSAHNVESLEQLVACLSEVPGARAPRPQRVA